MELVTGATGYVGGRLIERLLAEGRQVRALARDASRLEPREHVEVAAGDVLSGEGLRAALDGCEAAYYLVHSMEPPPAGSNPGDGHFWDRDRRGAENFARAACEAGVERVVYLGGIVPSDGPPPAGSTPGDGHFWDRDRRGAENFARAAREAGVERVAYLGGIVPSDGPLSAHIASRLEVEEILLDSAPAATALRASILVGARSASFRLLVRLVERMRILPLPGWRTRVTQPIAERDAVEFLARTPRVPEAAGRSLDIAGPDVVTYGEMVERIAEHMGVGRTPVRLGPSLTSPASALVSAVTELPLELVRPLMQSLERDLLPRDPDEAPRIYGIRPLSFDRAVERALADWERTEELAAR